MMKVIFTVYVTMVFLEDVTEEQKKDLEKEINKVIQNWLDKYDLRDYGFLIKNMEMVRV